MSLVWKKLGPHFIKLVCNSREASLPFHESLCHFEYSGAFSHGHHWHQNLPVLVPNIGAPANGVFCFTCELLRDLHNKNSISLIYFIHVRAYHMSTLIPRLKVSGLGTPVVAGALMELGGLYSQIPFPMLTHYLWHWNTDFHVDVKHWYFGFGLFCDSKSAIHVQSTDQTKGLSLVFPSIYIVLAIPDVYST